MDVFLDCLFGCFLKLVKEGVSCFSYLIFGICNLWLSACLTQNCNFIIKLFFPNVNPFQTELFSLLRPGGFGAPLYILKTAHDTTTVTMHSSSGIDAVEF